MAILKEYMDWKFFFFFDTFLEIYQVCFVKETFEYYFDDVRVDAQCWFYMYVGNGFLAVHFEFISVVNGVSIVNVQKIYFRFHILRYTG